MMPLWIVFPAVSLALFGVVVWTSAAASVHGNRQGPVPAETSEVTAWWRLVAPIFAGALVFAFLTGWAAQEPDPADEWVAFELFSLAAVVTLLVLRAFVRALRSAATATESPAPVGTVGLVRHRVVVSDAFKAAASEPVLAAALAHEAAHSRGRDPLRILLAQLAADLQWPIPHARRRLHDWRLALEMRRDDEAVSMGADKTALAESILIAAKLRAGHATPTATGLTGQGDGLAFRVRRLLADQIGGDPAGPPRTRSVYMACVLAIAVSVALGAALGDSLLLFLPGVGR